MTDEEHAAEADAYFEALDYAFDSISVTPTPPPIVVWPRAIVVRRSWWRRALARFEASK